MEEQLKSACLHGDLAFISQCLTDNTDMDHDVDWGNLMRTAYRAGHTDIVKCIEESNRVTLHGRLGYACLRGDMTFVSNCISDNTDRGQDVDWDVLMRIAYNMGHTDIVRCIGESKRGTLHGQLLSACLRGDLTFVSHCISNNTDRGQDVDWDHLMYTAHSMGYTDIVRCIGESGRVTLRGQLLSACMYSDLTFVSQCLADSVEPPNGWWYYSRLAYDRDHRDVGDLIIESSHLHIHNIPLQVILLGDHAWISAVIHHTNDVNIPHHNGLTVLHAVCYYDNIKLIKLLREKGADMNAVGYMGRTPLHILCWGRNDDMDTIIFGDDEHVEMERLQGRDKMIKQQVQSELSHIDNRLEIVKYLLENNVSVDAVDSNTQTPLHLACISGELAIIQLLIDAAANIDLLDAMGMSPLALASLQGHDKAIQLLVNKQCHNHQLNKYGQGALYHACACNHHMAAEILIQHAAIVNQTDCDGVTPVSISSWRGHTKIVSLLLDNQADANIVDKEGQAALHKVAIRGHWDTTTILLQHNVKFDMKDITGCTPLHTASKKHPDIVKLLLENRCVVDIPNNLGETALHVAVVCGETDIVKILLSYQADINHKNNSGRTPLLSAVSNLHIDIIMLLIENKADVNAVDNMGRGMIHAVCTSPYHSKLLHKLHPASKNMKVGSHKEQTLITLVSKSGQDQQFAVEGDAAPLRKAGQNLEKTMHSAFNTSVLEFVLSLNLGVNEVDFNEQTPLHLAADCGNVQIVHFLLDHRADITTRDKFGYLPIMLAVCHPHVFNILWNQIHTSDTCLTDDDFQQIMHIAHWFDAKYVQTKYEKLTMQKTDYNFCAQNIRKLDLNISKDMFTPWLNKDSDKLPDFMTNWLPSLQPLTYVHHPDILNVMDRFINDIQAGVQQVDPLVAFDHTLSGSEKEKTKVMATNERDALCMLKNIKFHMFDGPSICPAHPVLKAFVELVCKDKYVEQLKRVLDDQKRLSRANLIHYFSKAVSVVLAKHDLWKKYHNIQRVTVQDITSGNRTIPALIIRWHDEIYPLLEISIDLVPAIAMPQPHWCKSHSLLEKVDWVAVPKWKSSAPFDHTLMEVGVSQWGQVFDKMPKEMRQGYRLAKVIRDEAVCPQIEDWPYVHASDFITTYFLKQCIMKEYAATYDDQKSEPTAKEQKSSGPSAPKSDLYWAKRIYEVIEEAFINQHLVSFFFPKYNLLHDDKYADYRETAISYARLCRRLLTPESVQHFRKAYMGIQ